MTEQQEQDLPSHPKQLENETKVPMASDTAQQAAYDCDCWDKGSQVGEPYYHLHFWLEINSRLSSRERHPTQSKVERQKVKVKESLDGSHMEEF